MATARATRCMSFIASSYNKLRCGNNSPGKVIAVTHMFYFDSCEVFVTSNEHGVIVLWDISSLMSTVRHSYSMVAAAAAAEKTQTNGYSIEQSRSEGNNTSLLNKTDSANNNNSNNNNYYYYSKYHDDDDEIAHSRRFK